MDLEKLLFLSLMEEIYPKFSEPAGFGTNKHFLSFGLFKNNFFLINYGISKLAEMQNFIA